jgi:hypothetical protein
MLSSQGVTFTFKESAYLHAATFYLVRKAVYISLGGVFAIEYLEEMGE